MSLLLWMACAPAYRFPGPLGSLGSEDVPDAPAPSVPVARPSGGGAEIAEIAAGFVGASAIVLDGTRYRWDCSGLVEAALAGAGCAYRGSSAMLFEAARDAGVLHRRRRPQPGDVAFFDDTYDRDGNGRVDDPLSHVAVVEAVDEDGTIGLVHVGSKGVVRFVMNLRHPDVRDDADGKRLNDYLRAKGSDDGPRTRYLAGELWVAFGSFWKAEPAVADRSTR
ncbi:MAG: CHAP domain-containing protein [Myxococcota bacterium]